MFVSIIVPAYNCGTYFHSCITSILNQSFQDFELIIIDDGSFDGTESSCDKYAEENPQIKVIHQHNQGVAAARNRGLHEAVGEYIWFVDGDDKVHPHALEIYHQAYLKNKNIDCFIINHQETKDINQRFGEKNIFGKLINVQESRDQFRKFYFDCLGRSICCMVFRRTCSLEFLPFRRYEDLIFRDSLLLSGCLHQVWITREILYQYRMNPNSCMHQKLCYSDLEDRLLAVDSFIMIKGKMLSSVADIRGKMLSTNIFGFFSPDILSFSGNEFSHLTRLLVRAIQDLKRTYPLKIRFKLLFNLFLLHPSRITMHIFLRIPLVLFLKLSPKEKK